jgi:hypothetical protein
MHRVKPAAIAVIAVALAAGVLIYVTPRSQSPAELIGVAERPK